MPPAEQNLSSLPNINQNIIVSISICSESTLISTNTALIYLKYLSVSYIYKKCSNPVPNNLDLP